MRKIISLQKIRSDMVSWTNDWARQSKNIPKRKDQALTLSHKA